MDKTKSLLAVTVIRRRLRRHGHDQLTAGTWLLLSQGEWARHHEHHNTQGLAGSSPEVLIARVAAETLRIRVGSGGVMLSHYSPLKVAESFRVLHALYPGRIDLGIGRAPGSDQLTAAVLAQGRVQPIERFGQQFRSLVPRS